MNVRLPISTLKGIGEKKSHLLSKLNIYTINDLLHYYPRDYDIFRGIKNIAELELEQVHFIKGFLITGINNIRIKGLLISTGTLQDDTGSVQVTWYNQPYIKNQLKQGDEVIIKGKYIIKAGRKQISGPTIFKEEQLVETNHLLPIYPLTKHISNKVMTSLITNVLENTKDQINEFLSQEILKRFDLIPYKTAIESIHFPDSLHSMQVARKRLIFDEFFLFQLGLGLIKNNTAITKNNFEINSEVKLNALLNALPYDLTKAQHNVLQEIMTDLKGPHTMNRLIQGDVGSGKTIISALALLLMAENHHQGVLMAPTEVLATQHYASFKILYESLGIEVGILTGSMTTKQKNQVYADLASGKIDILIGTHAVIQDKVIFSNLGLVITDEQHRFGVNQREVLADKGTYPHVLVMSATPIPRTLALIVYGDMSISVIDELPKGRKPIKTNVVTSNYRERIYRFMAEHIDAGRQCYVICPMVEEQEELEIEDVTSYTENLKKHMPDKIRIASLHGQMKPKDKNQIMVEYANGLIDILVSTTVVEVGVNVPNATIMLIENAERFGLAQLHQLRGRVGRGSHESYCILITDSKASHTKQRLSIVKDSQDGFIIAEYDLKTRGPGDTFGTKQHGLPEFRIGNIYDDIDLLKETHNVVEGLLKADPKLEKPENEGLSRMITDYYNDQVYKISL